MIICIKPILLGIKQKCSCHQRFVRNAFRVFEDAHIVEGGKNMLNEQKIRIFLDLADTLSFTETAKNMFVSQQAVSKHIADLEREMGHTLFERNSREVSLTAAGLECMTVFSRFISDVARINNASDGTISQYKPIHAGFIAYNYYGEEAANAMHHFQMEYPHLSFTVACHSPMVLNKMLMTGSLDFIVTRKRFIPNCCGVSSIDIRSTRTVLVIAANHPILEDQNVDLSSAGLPIVFEMREGETALESITRMREEIKPLNLIYRDQIIVPNRASAFQAMEMGLGMMVINEMSISFCHGNVYIQPIEYIDSCVILWNNVDKRRFVERFAELLREEYNKSTVSPILFC